MPTEIILPRVDMDMATGKIGQWYVAEGGQVEKGQLLFELETSKAAMEIEAPAAGIVRDVTAKPGDELPVGTVIGRIFSVGEAYAAPSKPAKSEAAKIDTAPATQRAAIVARLEPGSPGGSLRATPKARRIARDAGIDLARVAGSGPHGRIQARDLAAGATMLSAPVAGGKALNFEWLARGTGTPLVLIHGFGADLNSWRPLLSYLPAGRPILALDLPGHGRSPLSGESSIEAMANSVEATLAQEGLGGAHLAGHSLGGAVAMALAIRPTIACKSLTLIAPAGLGPDINGAFVAGFLRAESEAALAPWINLLVGDPQTLGPALVKTTLRQRRDMGGADAQSAVAAALFPQGTQTSNVRSLLSRFSGPAKVIFGLSDQIIPASHAHGLPGTVGLHLFPGIGHMPQLEIRAEVARLLAENAAAADRPA